MRPLDLDFARRGGPKLAIYLLAAFSVAFLADAVVHHRNLLQDVEIKKAALSEQIRVRPRVRPLAVAAPSPEEYAFARDTINRLSTPWNELFEALESAQIEHVALLALEPDLEGRSVTISAEARNYLTALSYVAAVSDQRFLRNVHLVSHEMTGQAPRPLKFTLSARWKDQR